MPPRVTEIRPADRVHDLAALLARAVIRVRAPSPTETAPFVEASATSRLELSGASPLTVDPRGLTARGEGDER